MKVATFQKILIKVFIVMLILSNIVVSHAENASYPWCKEYALANTVLNRFAPPPGYERSSVSQGSFAYWLRNLPLKEGNPPVRLYSGELKNNQNAHAAVIDIDVGKKDLQQCADAVMRLRAEYLYSQKHYDMIHFNFTSGHRASYSQWRQGFRPTINGSQVHWKQRSTPSTTYDSFRQYLEVVFIYAGTLSLSAEMQATEDIAGLQPGDVFIEGGSPGHAIIIIDTAIHPTTKKKVFLLAQSYMPAQDIHLLNNPGNDNSPWYSTDFGEKLETPEWIFRNIDLKRFKID